MARKNEIPTTSRAYTFRLQGVGPDDKSWRQLLWQTHETINIGAKAFGDWLLTMRGGIEHTLADAKGKKNGEAKMRRRVLLGLSWLSVESRNGAPEGFIVASGDDPANERNKKVLAAFENILKGRGLGKKEIEEWINDCSDSLCAEIRKDAVWINRSKAFDKAVHDSCSAFDRDEIWDMLGRFFGSPDSYLAPVNISEDESSETESEEKVKDLVQKAGQWLSSRFGTGKGADFQHMASVYRRISSWAGDPAKDMSWEDMIRELSSVLSSFRPEHNGLQGILALISGPGYKSGTRTFLMNLSSKKTIKKEDFVSLRDKADDDIRKCRAKSGMKGRRPYSDRILKDVESVSGLTYLCDDERARHREYSVMLDHAARRVSLAHTWIKRAEAERVKFAQDAEKMNRVPAKAREWLDSFCLERSMESGALETYRIRRRAIDGWKEVVSAWSKSLCRNCEDRIAAARMLQEEIEKFGDIQLYEALADDKALCVWHKDGDPEKAPDSQALADYVISCEAVFKKKQFKVPAYRHPDALLHPVFCDFGNSRWGISYDVHKDMNSQSPNIVHLSLCEDNVMKERSFRWQSKKLMHDLAIGTHEQTKDISEVTRADRLGRAASNVMEVSSVLVKELYEQKDWNGRLQAPRPQLEAIAAVRDNQHLAGKERDKKISKMKDNIRWLMTFSAKLQPRGPWIEYAKANKLRVNPIYWPHSEENKKREGLSRMILPRLPDLRILSVDLGHRYAAACAVWETANSEQINKACKAAGQREPNESDLYLHLRKDEIRQKGKNLPATSRITIYRRIAADKLCNGKPHPAPWARLDRQFLVKLQGEEEGCREASNGEIWSVHLMEKLLGRPVPLIDRMVKGGWGRTDKQRERLSALEKMGWKPIKNKRKEILDDEGNDSRKISLSVDDLMSSAVRTMRLGLQRHGDRARIAFALNSKFKPMPGDRKYYFNDAKEASLNDDIKKRKLAYIDFIQDALLLWSETAYSRGWADPAARELWNCHIATIPGYMALEQAGQNASERGQGLKLNRDRLRAPAEVIAGNAGLRKLLYKAWLDRWTEDDLQWKKVLRWARDWVQPGGNHANDPAIRRVGGLSLDRLATLTEFRRKVQIGYFSRLKPDGTRNDIGEHFGQRALDALEHMREQRVKQLASRITEAALGIGRVGKKLEVKSLKRPLERVDKACHAVVIEDLTHYRPEETRTRRENRQLMSWSSSKVKKYLAEGCQLNGLHLREVQAGYTSRQDSRTGAPGLRCQDVPLREFLCSPFWRKQVNQAVKRIELGKGDARERLLHFINEKIGKMDPADMEKYGTIRIPLKGGEIFVSADPKSPTSKGIQADLNAAANIGLRALNDPDWPGKWWYIPCDPATFKPDHSKVKGSIAIDLSSPLINRMEVIMDGPKSGSRKSGSVSKEVVNLWRDISCREITSENGPWETYPAYTNRVQERVIRLLRDQFSHRG